MTTTKQQPSVRQAAQNYIGRGFSVVPVPKGGKKPVVKAWTQGGFTENDITENVGILCGALSGNLVDVDLDCPEAIEAACYFLPPTGMIHGRASNPKSHWWYVADVELPTKRYKDADGRDDSESTTLVEYRTSGSQTLVPPSVHPEGEAYVWERDGEPERVDAEELWQAVSYVAATSLLARHWPGEGSRHDCALAVAGLLLRGGLDENVVSDIVAYAAEIAGDEEAEERRRDVATTAAKLFAGESATGGPTLSKFMSEKGVGLLRDWLGLRKEQEPRKEPVEPAQQTKTAKQSDMLLELGKRARLFHTPDGTAYADIAVGASTETCPIRSRTYKDWLLVAYDDMYGGAPSNNAMQEALNTLDSRARLRGEEQEVFLRLGTHGGALYLDMCNQARHVIKVTSEGWQIIPADNAPVRFRRTPEMLERPLPTPRRDGSLDMLFKVLNVSAEDDKVLVKGFLLGLLHPTGPYPGLALYGEQGSAKSSAARYIRQVIDPTSALVTGEPRDAETIALQANANWVPVFDNVRTIRDWLSDALCRLSTGSAYNKRSHYENIDLTVVKSKRPFILTSITDAVQNPDLINRVLTVRLPVIPKDKRKSEDATDAEFASKHPHILGALLDASVDALAGYRDVELDELPRMADLAKWVTAAEPAMGLEPGTFIRAYTGNETDAYEAAINANLVAQAIIRFMESQDSWTGTPASLYAILSEQESNQYGKRPNGWPGAPQWMSNKLSEAAPALRAKYGIDIQRQSIGSERGLVLARVERVEQSDATDATDAIFVSLSFREREENKGTNHPTIVVGKEKLEKVASVASIASVDDDDDLPNFDIPTGDLSDFPF